MMSETLKTSKQAASLLLVLSLICGVIYPVVVTVLSLLFFPAQSGGSLIREGSRIVGSQLIAQKFTEPRYFHPRPSAADYSTLPSGASNQSPTSKSLTEAIQGRRQMLGSSAPSDLLTSSASGLDPHITPTAAYFQIERIASARNLEAADIQRLRELVVSKTEKPTFGFIGKNRINVLLLNMQLDKEF